MAALEKNFEKELIQKINEAETKGGIRNPRFLQTIEKFGGIKTVKEIMRKGRISDNFDQLQKAGLLHLTMEALVIDKKYGELFTDEEVNSCYELLCEHGYY